jgi:glycosyltransferase involved in cell wall biosynthesis
MGTLNGAKFLAEQLDSLEAQRHTNWRLIASDDGSADDTINILKHYQVKWGAERLEIRQGPATGFSSNFLSLACDSGIQADLYAYCDQDDVWQPEKLEVAANYLKAQRKGKLPYVYCGRTKYVSETLKSVGFSPMFVYPRSFRNALVQSIAGGNTMVFNQQAKTLLEKAGQVEVAAHDWWTYLLVKAAGGKVYYDATPHIFYRQHPDAAIGGNTSKLARFDRLKWLLLGRFKVWNDMHVAALQKNRRLMTESSLETLDQFVRIRGSHLLHRFRMLEVCGLYRQSWRGTLSLYLAALLKKI